MKVVLLADIKGTGKKHEVKEVSEGYARNMLFPKKLAEPASDDALKRLARMKDRQDAEEKALHAKLVGYAEAIGHLKLVFDLKVDKKGTVFGSVSKEQVLKALRDRGIVGTERVEVVLEHPLKKIGPAVVRVDLKRGIQADLHVTLRGQE